MATPADPIASTPNFGDVVAFNCVLVPILCGGALLQPLAILVFVFISVFVSLPPSALVFLFVRRWQGRAGATLISSLGGWLGVSGLLAFLGNIAGPFWYVVLIAHMFCLVPYLISAVIYLFLCRAMCAHERKQQAASPPARVEE